MQSLEPLTSRAPVAALACLLWAGAATPAPADGANAKGLSEKERGEISAVFEELFTSPGEGAESGKVKEHECKEEVGKKGECCGKAKDAFAKTQKKRVSYLVKVLADKPEAWEVVEPLIVDRYACPDSTQADRDRMLELLAAESSKKALSLGGALWKKSPESFGEDQLLMFAERGGKDFAKGLAKLAFENGRGARTASIRPAAFLALQGDDTHRKTLVRALKTGACDGRSACDVLVAGLALKKLGEPDALCKARARVHEDVIAALDSGDVERARDMALCAEFLRKGMESRKCLSLSFLGQRADYHCQARSQSVASADQVFELIEEISPR